MGSCTSTDEESMGNKPSGDKNRSKTPVPQDFTSHNEPQAKPKKITRNAMKEGDAKRLYLLDVPDFPQMHESRIRIGRPYSFKPVLTCGGFSYDRGSYTDGIIINDTFYRDPHAISNLVLLSMPQWGNQPGKSRESLCLKYAKEVLLDFRLVMDESVSEAKRTMPQFFPGYHRPTTELNASSAIIVKLWVRWSEKGDLDSDNTYRHVQYTIDAKGCTSPPQILETRIVHIRRRSLVEEEGL